MPLTPGQFSSGRPLDLDALGASVAFESVPQYLRTDTVASDVPPSGEMRCTRINLFGGATVVRAGYTHAGGAVGLTLWRLGVYNAAFALVASTATFHGTVNGQAAGYYEQALSTPYTIPSDGPYYIGFLGVGGTAPTVNVAVNTSVRPVNGIYSVWRQLGLADLPATATRADGSFGYYMTLI